MKQQTNICFRAPQELVNDVDELVRCNRYKNRSDVCTTALRMLIRQEKPILEARIGGKNPV